MTPESDLEYRDALEGNPRTAYTLHPYAAAELREKAKKVLGEGPQLDRLMKRLEAQGALNVEAPPKAK